VIEEAKEKVSERVIEEAKEKERERRIKECESGRARDTS
jgi:hypothetical protein